MGVQILTGVQLVKETVPGTLEPATAIFAGLTAAQHKPSPALIRPTIYQGVMAKNGKTVVVGKRGEIHLEGFAAFDDFNYLLGMTMKGGVTGSGDAGTPKAYTRNYGPAMTSPDAPDRYSMELGENTQYFLYNGVFGTMLEVTGKADDLTTFSWDGYAKNGIAGSKTGALSIRDQEAIPANNWVLSIDATGGTLGATPYAGCLRDFRLRLPGFAPLKCMDGTQYYTSIIQPDLVSSLEVTLLLDSTSIALLTGAYMAGTRLLCRLQVDGSNIHGSTTVNRRLQFNISGVIEDCSRIGSQMEQGQNTLRLTIGSEYDPTAALLHSASTVTSLSALV